MANEINPTVATEFIPTEVLSQYIYRAAYASSALAGYVAYGSLMGQPGLTFEFPKSPLVEAAALTQGVDLANTPFNPTSSTITVGEVGLMISPTDLMMSAAIVGENYFVEQLSLALGTKLTTDIAANSSSITTSVGTTTQDLTETNFLDAKYNLRNGNAQGPFFAALHPIQVRDLQVDIATSAGAIWGASAGPDSVIAEMAMLYNVLIIETTCVPTANAGADRGGFMAPQGQACGIAWVEKTRPGLERQRDASARLTEYVAVGTYGTGCPNPAANGAIGITTDA